MLDIATNGQVLAAERNGPIWVTKTELSPPPTPMQQRTEGKGAQCPGAEKSQQCRKDFLQ